MEVHWMVWVRTWQRMASESQLWELYRVTGYHKGRSTSFTSETFTEWPSLGRSQTTGQLQMAQAADQLTAFSAVVGLARIDPPAAAAAAKAGNCCYRREKSFEKMTPQSALGSISGWPSPKARTKKAPSRRSVPEEREGRRKYEVLLGRKHQ